jgi:L-Ala-D/L-Glu epimerase
MLVGKRVEMRIHRITHRLLTIPFKVAFKHASAERKEMQSLWVEVRSSDGEVGVGEGCPRAYVTSESFDTAKAFIERHSAEWIANIQDVQSLSEWIENHATLIDLNPAAWSAVEIAILDCLGKSGRVPIEELLGIPTLDGTFRYTAVLGDAAPPVFEAQLAQYLEAGFNDVKIKLSGAPELDASKVRALISAGISAEHVRADANNLWKTAEEAIAHLTELAYPFGAIEEPIKAGDHDGMRKIARSIGSKIVLDESALTRAHLKELKEDPERWIVNLRVSKMGGIIRSLDFVRAADAIGVPLIIGAHVGETSVLTRAALSVANFGRGSIVGQEGAFGTRLLERDVVTPALMFGSGGILDAHGLKRPGLGLGDCAMTGPATQV